MMRPTRSTRVNSKVNKEMNNARRVFSTRADSGGKYKTVLNLNGKWVSK